MAGRIAVYAALAVMVVVSIGSLWWQPGEGDGLSPAAPRAVSRVTVRTASGDTLELADGARPAVLVFGYPDCGDACPRVLAVLSAAATHSGVKPAPRLAFVDLDRWHRSPATLRAFLRRFPGVEGIAPDRPTLESMTMQLGLRPIGDERELASHDARIFVLDARGTLLAALSPSPTTGEVERELRRYFAARAASVANIR